jgi:hypothetical protein
MKLLTKEILRDLPALGSTNEDDDPIVRVKYFTPDAGWTWYVTEGDRDGETDDYLFFGYVVGPCPEWGEFRLSELQKIRGALRLQVERDLHFQPRRFSELDASEKGGR